VDRDHLRIAADDEGPRVEILRPDGGGILRRIGSFPCELIDLRAVLDGRTYQVCDGTGFLMMRATGENVWFVFTVNRHDYESSCLVPRELVEEAATMMLMRRSAEML